MNKESKPTNATPPTIDLKTKEKWLREEIRADRRLMMGMIQWGVGILAALQLNLFYIRRDVAKYLLDNKVIQPGELFPVIRWLMGTLLLTVIACIFTAYYQRIVVRHLGHRRDLETNGTSIYSGITEQAPVGTLVNAHKWLFFAFPAIDVLTYLAFCSTGKL